MTAQKSTKGKEKDAGGESAGQFDDLARFVEESLAQLIEGIVAAQMRVDPLGAQINPEGSNLPFRPSEGPIPILSQANQKVYLQQVDFDIAVTRSREHGRRGGGNIQVLGLDMGGSAGSANATTNVSRIKFSIPVLFPGDGNPKVEAALEEMRRRSEANQQRSTGRGSWMGR